MMTHWLGWNWGKPTRFKDPVDGRTRIGWECVECGWYELMDDNGNKIELK